MPVLPNILNMDLVASILLTHNQQNMMKDEIDNMLPKIKTFLPQ